MIVDIVAVRDRLGLGSQIPDETVTALRDAVEATVVAVYPLADSDPPGAAAVEAVLQLCRDVWMAGRHAYDTVDGYTPMVTSSTLQRYGALLAPYRAPGTMAL